MNETVDFMDDDAIERNLSSVVDRACEAYFKRKGMKHGSWMARRDEWHRENEAKLLRGNKPTSEHNAR